LVGVSCVVGCDVETHGLRPLGEAGQDDAGRLDAGRDAGSDEGGVDAPSADGGAPDAPGLLDTGPCEPATEVCNGRDDDCDAETDEGCPCDVVVGAASIYLFCTTPREWNWAHDGCTDVAGFDYVMIQNATEDAFVWGEAMARDGASDWWIGLEEPEPNVYAWVDGTEVWNGGARAYHNFAGGAPVASVPDDCGQLDSAEGGAWIIGRCSDAQPYVCESPIL
jgi:hypothetical protein